MPPIQALNEDDIPNGYASPPEPGASGRPSGLQIDEWMWQLDPGSSMRGLAMNVIALPWRWAISLAPFLYTVWLSAMVSALAYRRLSSCWPGAASLLQNST